MTCEHKKSYVIDSRPGEFGLRRRRECADCGFRWSTIEITLDAHASARGVDPWMIYRKRAIEKYLKQRLENIQLDLRHV